MPFDWYHPNIPERFQEKIQDRFHQAYIAETRFRARLFLNLGYTKEYAIKRIQENLAWEFELSSIPGFYDEIPAVVAEVYEYHQGAKNQPKT
jgi:hypothetical protein